MKRLFPSFADPAAWRDNFARGASDRKWRALRESVLERDDSTCRYCGFRTGKWQVVHHIDGNPGNDDMRNLETVCPMCNLILHAGLGCVVQGIVDLFEESDYSQPNIIRITRRLRAEGGRDEHIIGYLGLKRQAPFRMSRMYLRGLYGFITSRKAGQDWTREALEYGYWIERERRKEVNRSLLEFPGFELEDSDGAFGGDEGWEDAAEEFYLRTAVDSSESIPSPDRLPPPGRRPRR